MIVVAKDGSGDFTRIQDAIDALPEAAGHSPSLILVRAGEYFFARDGLTGLGDVVENQAHMFCPLSVAAGNFRFYAVFMLECACALLVCGVALLVQKIWKNSYREGFAAERIAFYLALLQIFCQRLLAGLATRRTAAPAVSRA